MTRHEEHKDLAEKARRYDDLHNEGGEGYNPYRDQIKALPHDGAPTSNERRDELVEKLLMIPDHNDARYLMYSDERKAEIEAMETELAKLEAK